MQTIRTTRWLLPAVGLAAALLTNTIANAGVLPSTGALLLFPLLVLCWSIERFSRREMGFVRGPLHHYGLGLLHPLLVLGLIALLAWLTGATTIDTPDWSSIAREFVLAALVTMAATLVTEDGFFRGWLWASLRRAGMHEQGVVLLTGIAFGLWHLPYAVLATGYAPLSAEVALLILNASIVGIAWGLLRRHSGSVVVPAVTHGVWNGAVYVLFNYGTEIGALGIQDTAVFGPEAGLAGLVLNSAYALGLWLWYRRAAGRARPAPSSVLTHATGARS
jgi:membrane protease YdiL (CAAX protease family)